ncbi:restriction endonuclease subunit S [Mesorhizobium tamadayense]|uniref:Restriction endonuclease subunit S n=2 Tax=Mesorhizobium tamadayense TaxID=425306 RepID=A0A3P3EUP2_9HYPH|nr:restriction endonuclease subunit S [Mesorhizobium tamadayense]
MNIQPNNRPVEVKSNQRPAAYPSYKPARVHWLGEIPAHWQEKRGKYFFREIDERSATGEEELLSVSHTTGVTPRSQKNVTMFKAESYVGHKVAKPNDVVINTMWAWMSALGVSKHVGIVSPAYGVYRPLNQSDFLPEYIDYLLRTPLLKWEYICRSTGIRSSRLRLYPDKFLDIAFPCPPRVEQERMVAFLRAKEVQVRRLIRNKRRLIGLLNEQKQAIIYQAVTRGLSRDAPMKPTGIDWMPAVPAHWEVVSLKRVCFLHRGYDLPDEKRIEGPYPVVSSAGVIGSHDKFMTRGPGVATGRYGSTGRLFYIEEDFWPHNTALYVSQFQGNLPRYVFYLLQTLRYDEYSDKSAVPGIDRKDLHDIRVAKAPQKEQQAIAGKIDEDLAELDQAIEKIVSEIRLIREYRERLIADVVTGKVDVRHIEISAPANELALDEDEALEEYLEPEEAEVMEGADADE